MIKKIAIVLPEFSPEKIINVPWRQTFELATRLNKKGIETAIVTSSFSEQKFENIPIIEIDENPIRKLSKVSIEKIISFSPDIIYWIGNTYSGRYLKQNKFNVPLVLQISTMHILSDELKNFDVNEILKDHVLQLFTSFYPFYKVVSSLNGQNISKIISTSKTITDRLVKLGINESKIITSPLFFENDLPKIEHMQEIKNIICYTGPLNSIRGSTIILEAISILKKKNVDVKLLFLLRTTKKQDKIDLENFAKKMGISYTIEIVAKMLTREELASYFAKSGIIAIPTKFVWNEPPLTILEAMNLGKPVITTDVCGIPEIVSGHAITVSPSADEFASKIEFLLKNEAKKNELATSAKKYTQSLQNWDNMTDWTLDTLQKIVEQK